jgi:hypothetical protein
MKSQQRNLKMKKFIAIIFCINLVLVAICSVSFAQTTIYANSSTGNDATGNGTAGNPYKTFHKGYTMASTGNILDLTGTFTWTDAGESGDLQYNGYQINKNLTIRGQNPTTTIVQAHSSPNAADRRVFEIMNNCNVIFENIQIRHGIGQARWVNISGSWVHVATAGGAIGTESSSTGVNLSLINVLITENFSSSNSYTAGVYCAGTLYAERSSFINTEYGIQHYYGVGTSRIVNCTFQGNSYRGIMIDRRGSNIINCTFSGNETDIYTHGTTLSDQLKITNTIIANCVNGFVSSGPVTEAYFLNSIVENRCANSASVSLTNTLTGVQANLNMSTTPSNGSNNMLTPYLELFTGSVAIAAGATVGTTINCNNGGTSSNPLDVPSDDQRGIVRNNTPSIGAYEGTLGPPSIQASNITFPDIQYNKMTIGWTNGDGANRVVFMKQAASGTTTVTDNTTYTASTLFGMGDQISSTGWFCVYNGASNSVTVNGLSVLTDYIVQVFEYNSGVGSEEYLNNNSGTDNPATETTVALITPTVQATNITFSDVTHAGMKATWTNGNGGYRLAFLKQASSGTTTPVDNTTYTADANLGDGNQIGTTGWFCVYKGTGNEVSITGLADETTYILQVFEYNGDAGDELYLTSTATNNPKSQITSQLPQDPYEFTNCGATGSTGPNQAQVNSTYLGTNLDGQVTINTQGIQEWLVPASGKYIIETQGAKGGGTAGGNGAKMIGEFDLQKDDKLYILVGQRGLDVGGVRGGGGGGSFVATGTNLSTSTPLIIAGGGGGMSNNGTALAGVTTEDGTNGQNSSVNKGTDGYGGAKGSSGYSGLGGGGFYGDGTGTSSYGYVGIAFRNGGAGGTSTDGNGGFGGGGGNGWYGGGGAGGYSGGGGGNGDGYGGGGGGSYNSGANQNNEADVNLGHGYVIIEYLPPSTPVWTGASDNDWNTNGNWSGNSVPTPGEDIIISPTASSDLILDQSRIVGELTFQGANRKVVLGEYSLTVNQVTGADANNYIKTSGSGKLIKEVDNTGSFKFDVGNTSYNPVSITNNTGSADDFSVKVQDGTDYASNNARIDRTWHIDKATPNGGAGINFTFYWNEGEVINGPITTALMLYHYTPPYWYPQYITASNINAYDVTFNSYKGSFSPLAIGGDESQPLPVSILELTAVKNKASVVISWQTATETNNAGFEVERSENAKDFEMLGMVAGAGNSNMIQYYNFTDYKPLSSTAYYRLKQVDYDGAYEYSPIVAVALQEDETGINSISAENGILRFHISGMQGESLIRIFDISGRIVYSKSIITAAAQEYEILLPNLSKGLYMMNVYNDGKQKNVKFVLK